jgi:hypothetical protein
VHPYTTTYHVALNLTSLQRWAPALPRVPQSRTSPTYRGGLQRYHVSHGPGARLPVEVGSSASMCPMATGSASLREELQYCHVSYDPQ